MGLKQDAMATVEVLTKENAELRASRERAYADIERLSRIVAAASKMRKAQRAYYRNRKNGASPATAMALEKAFDRLDDPRDDPQGKLFPDVDPEMSARCQEKPDVDALAHVVPKGPNMANLIELKTRILARPSCCDDHALAYPHEYRSPAQNKIDAITWTKGAVDIVLASGQAETHEDAARKLLNGIRESEGMG